MSARYLSWDETAQRFYDDNTLKGSIMQDSTGRDLHLGDEVSYNGRIWTIYHVYMDAYQVELRTPAAPLQGYSGRVSRVHPEKVLRLWTKEELETCRAAVAKEQGAVTDIVKEATGKVQREQQRVQMSNGDWVNVDMDDYDDNPDREARARKEQGLDEDSEDDKAEEKPVDNSKGTPDAPPRDCLGSEIRVGDAVMWCGFRLLVQSWTPPDDTSVCFVLRCMRLGADEVVFGAVMTPRADHCTLIPICRRESGQIGDRSVLKMWDGDKWVPVSSEELKVGKPGPKYPIPASPKEGDITDDGPGWKVYNGIEWLDIKYWDFGSKVWKRPPAPCSKEPLKDAPSTPGLSQPNLHTEFIPGYHPSSQGSVPCGFQELKVGKRLMEETAKVNQDSWEESVRKIVREEIEKWGSEMVDNCPTPDEGKQMLADIQTEKAKSAYLCSVLTTVMKIVSGDPHAYYNRAHCVTCNVISELSGTPFGCAVKKGREDNMEGTDKKHWWLQPMTLESLRDLQATVKEAHSRGFGMASVTMNQIKIALRELEERMLKDESKKEVTDGS
jgi:hypothetical protein